MDRLQKFDLTGRVALITGASSYGIGSSSAKLLAEAGAEVFLVARREDKLKEVAEQIEAAGGTAGYFACNVADEESCKTAVEACVEKYGRLDIMVLSAGISGLTASDLDAYFDTDNWRNINGINLDGVFFMIKHGYKECAKGGVGSIIPVSSLAAWKAEGSGAYTATKGAIRSLTHSLAKVLAPLNIRVNTIYPGMTDTDMTHITDHYEFYEKAFMPKIPLQRFGTAEEMAYAILYLASDASAFTTGWHIVADGGQLF